MFYNAVYNTEKNERNYIHVKNSLKKYMSSTRVYVMNIIYTNVCRSQISNRRVPSIRHIYRKYYIYIIYIYIE